MAEKTSRLNVVDRVVSWVSPGAGVKRAQARAILSYYEAAKPDRLRKGRRATGSGNDEVLKAGASLRQIARHLEENYDLALGVLNTLVAGATITAIDGGKGQLESLVSGYSGAYFACAVLLGVGAIVTAVMYRRRADAAVPSGVAVVHM